MTRKLEHGAVWLADLNPRRVTEPGKTRPVLIILHLHRAPDYWLLATDVGRPPGVNSIKKELKDLWFKGEE